MFAMSTLHDWVPDPGSITCWHPSAAASLNARHAPVSPVPPSYQQTQHLRRYCDHAARGLEMTRMMIFTWEVPGRCDLRAMGYAINAHLRRHDTYRTWFEYKDADNIVRRTIADPAEIEFVPIEHKDMTTAELRDHISAPHPLQWGCFLFGVIQSADHFTFYASIGHLCVDLMIVPVLFTEMHTMYTTLVRGGVPAPLPAVGKYEDYCARQRRETSALTVDSPSIRAWFEFAEHSGGTLPHFPLPLGDLSVPCTGELLDVTLMDEQQTRRFDDAVRRGGRPLQRGRVRLRRPHRARADRRRNDLATHHHRYPQHANRTRNDRLVHRPGSGYRARHGDVVRRHRPGRADFLRLGSRPGDRAVRPRVGVGAAGADAAPAPAGQLRDVLPRCEHRPAFRCRQLRLGFPDLRRRPGFASGVDVGGPVPARRPR